MDYINDTLLLELVEKPEQVEIQVKPPKQGTNEGLLPLLMLGITSFLIGQLLLVPQATLSAKLIEEVAKIYTQNMKYNGTNSNFDYKLTIFEDVY